MRRALLVAFAAASLVAGSARADAPARADGTDPKGDLVNPVLGAQPPGALAYGYPAQDLRAWSLSATGTLLRAEITTEGRWRDWIGHPAWGTLPSFLILFRSPRLVTGVCPYCEGERGDQLRIGLMFRTNPCPGTFPPEAALVAWDPYATQPVVLASGVTYRISADERTLTLEAGYTHGAYEIARSGDVLDDVSAQTLTWTAAGVYSGSAMCAMTAVPEGTVDWAPSSAWDPVQRIHRTTGIQVRA